MQKTVWRLASVLAPALLFIHAASATTVAQLSFEQLTDSSEVVASGQITRSWTAWDAEGKYIWTHYELAVAAEQKGDGRTTVEFAEPGGMIGNVGTLIAGSVQYKVGDKVFVFLQRMPNGYLRTTGWGQGKYRVDTAGRLHPEVAAAEVVEVKTANAAAATSLRTLDGMSVGEIGNRVAARLRAARQGRP